MIKIRIGGWAAAPALVIENLRAGCDDQLGVRHVGDHTENKRESREACVVRDVRQGTDPNGDMRFLKKWKKRQPSMEEKKAHLLKTSASRKPGRAPSQAQKRQYNERHFKGNDIG